MKKKLFVAILLLTTMGIYTSCHSGKKKAGGDQEGQDILPSKEEKDKSCYLTEEKTFVNGQPVLYKASWENDKLVMIEVIADGGSKKINYQYTADGQLSVVNMTTDESTESLEYFYEGEKLTKIEGEGFPTRIFTYNDKGQIMLERFEYPEEVVIYEYSYDDDEQPGSINVVDEAGTLKKNIMVSYDSYHNPHKDFSAFLNELELTMGYPVACWENNPLKTELVYQTEDVELGKIIGDVDVKEYVYVYNKQNYPVKIRVNDEETQLTYDCR